MLKIGTIIYSVDRRYGDTPYIVYGIENDVIFCVSINLTRCNNDRINIAKDKILHNCFDMNEAQRTAQTQYDYINPIDEKKIELYCKNKNI
jgi:hypothetical protein